MKPSSVVHQSSKVRFTYLFSSSIEGDLYNVYGKVLSITVRIKADWTGNAVHDSL